MADVINGFDAPKDASGTLNAPRVNGRNIATSVTFAAPVAGASNVATIKLTARDGHGNAITTPTALIVYLSDSAAGVGHSATTASGTVTNVTSGGLVMGTLTAKQSLIVQTLADGTFNLQITDSAKTGFRVCAQLLNTGEVFVAPALVTANYGA
jgi:hypothetical protein